MAMLSGRDGLRSVMVSPLVHQREILPGLCDLSRVYQRFLQIIRPVHVHVMDPGQEGSLDLFQPTADLVCHFSCRTVETRWTQTMTQGAQNRVCQRAS